MINIKTYCVILHSFLYTKSLKSDVFLTLTAHLSLKGRVSPAQQPHVASGYWIGTRTSRQYAQTPISWSVNLEIIIQLHSLYFPFFPSLLVLFQYFVYQLTIRLIFKPLFLSVPNRDSLRSPFFVKWGSGVLLFPFTSLPPPVSQPFPRKPFLLHCQSFTTYTLFCNITFLHSDFVNWKIHNTYNMKIESLFSAERSVHKCREKAT